MMPAVAIALLLVLRPARPARPPSPTADDVAMMATLLGLALRSGLSINSGLRWVAPYLPDPLAAEVRAALRSATLSGLGPALRSHDGPAGGLFAILARSVETGAPAAEMIDGYVERADAEAKAQAVAGARRLPVKLLFPLALLMLPGLVLMVSGPALLEVFSRFS